MLRKFDTQSQMMRGRGYLWLRSAKEWLDVHTRFKRAQQANLALEAKVASNAHFIDELTRRAEYAERVFEALRRERSDLLAHADMLFAFLPKSPIPMSEILTWRANYRQLRIENQ